MQCEKCNKEFPSKYYFKFGNICIECYEKLDNEQRFIIDEKIRLETERTLKKYPLVSVLKGILTFCYGFIIVTGVFVALAFVVQMIHPYDMKFDTFEKFNLIYRLSPIDQIDSYKISSIDPKLNFSDVDVMNLGSIRFKTSDRIFLSYIFVYHFILLSVIIIILKQLRKFLGSLETGNPFVVENAKRLRIIGWNTIILQLILLIKSWGLFEYLKHPVALSNFRLSILWYSYQDIILETIGEIFFGLIVLAIAEVFRLGAKIRQEHELTI